MTGNKNICKHIISGIIVICLVVALLPASAFAADINSSSFVPMYRTLNPDGTYGEKLSSNELIIVETGDLHKTPDGQKIDLWVTSREEPYQIPCVKDMLGNTWYLQNISLINDYIDPTETQEVMNADAILAADSMDDYVFDPANITISDYFTIYFFYYGWTLTPPERWDDPGEQATYTVDYDLNNPSGVDSISIINENGIPPQEGQGYNKVPEIVEELGGTVQEGMNFAVASGLNDDLKEEELKGFLAYNVNDSSTTSYYFAGWEDKNGNLYDTDIIVTATEDLADENNVIQFTGVWEEINPYTEEKLADIETRVPLDVFTRGDNGNLLIAQSTDTLTKEDNLISYTVSAGFNGNLLAKDDGVAFKGSDFATFEIIVNVDPNLEFSNLSDDGTVTLSMASNLVIPQTIETTGGPVNWIGSEGNWTVTVDAAALSNTIVINAAFTDENYKNFADKMTLTGLDFKLKDGAFDVDGVAPEVKTSANMTAKIVLRNMAGPGGSTGWANTRFRYFVLRNLLMNNKAWSTYFDDGLHNPTVYMHALQFLDYKLADYDLSVDTLASLKANTVVANGEFTITATAGEHGSISPSGTVPVKRDGSQSFTITPDSGYRISDVLVDGASVGAVTSYTFSDVQADHTISVTFKEPEAVTHTITATAGSNGSISPSGTVTVEDGTDQTFTITANSGYHISDVLVDGASVGAVSSYTFENVTGDHTIAATFARDSGGGGVVTPTQYTITAEAGDGGSINPDGRVRVDRGDDQTFRITPDDGYEIADVLVDGESVGAVSRYTFENVRANHTIEVIFEAVEEVPGVADPDDTGVSDWLNTEDHNAYLSGYPGSLFGPDNNMTRAEVAQMFYNLLLDKDVAITVTFDDVPADAWYAEAVNTLASLGMITGVGNNQFEPERSITRAEFTTIAMRFTDGVLDGENIFPDVNPDDWFYDYVVGSIQYGWINGYPDGTFGPNDPISRAEVTTITNRMLGRSADEAFVDSNEASLVRFGDITDRHWAYYQVMEATNAHDYTETNGVEDWTSLN